MNTTAAEAFPLSWPQGWPRTAQQARTTARFKVSIDRGRRELLAELRRLGAGAPVISTNMPLRLDGELRANARVPDDRGVAVYFTWKGKQHVMACDRFMLIEDNIRAIGLSIAALRALERYGASDILERAFRGFAALPAPGDAPPRRPARAAMDFAEHVALSAALVEDRFRVLCKQRHPDAGGDPEAFKELVAARDELLAELGRPR